MATPSQNLNPRAIFSKTGKGVQEASGKTSHLSRADRAVLKEIDGKTTLGDVALKFDKIPADKFDALIQQLDKDGFVREVSSGASAEPIAPIRRTVPPPKAPPPKAAPPPPSSGGDGDGLDFTQAISLPPKGAPVAPKAPTVDLAAASRAEAERKAKEQAAVDYRARQEAEARAAAEAKGKAEAEARARAAAEATARAETEARAKAEAEAKAKQGRDMALRMAAEAKAKAESEAKDKARLEAELKGKLEEERKAREDAERRAHEAADRARKELEEKSKREAEELRQRLEAEMKAKLEEERRAREEEDRKRREEEDRRRKEEHERREKEHAERRAKEEAERKRREEEDRKRREEEDRRRKEEHDRREKEQAERRAKEEAERKRRDEEDRKRRDEDDRRRREESERRATEETDSRSRAPAAAPPPAAPAAAAGGGDFGSLLDDLDSFGQKDEEERKAKEEAERKAKEEADARTRAEEERKRREENDRKRREEEERRAKAEAERRAKEEEERRAREEEERRKEEEAERKRQAKEAQERKQAEQRAAEQRASSAPSKAPAKAGARDEDVKVSDDDLDMDDVKRDEAAISKEARRAAKEREEVTTAAMRPVARRRNWGKPVALALFVILIGGVGALHVMPLSTADYEKAASEALGAPVKVSSARLSVITGVKVNLEGVTVGDTRIRLVRGFPEIGSLFGPKKIFSRIELEGAELSQAALGQAMFGKVGGDNFRVGRIVLKQVKLEGPLTLPPLDIEAAIGSDGAAQIINISGPDKLAVRITPSGENIAFEASAGSLALPFVPALTLSDFGWKGAATRQGITQSEFDGRAFDGLISGTARVRWGASWTVDGEVRSRGVKVAVFAPTLVSEGKVESRGNYTMSGPTPAKLGESARIEGSFKIENGVIGNFDLGRALQTGGAQTQGRTEFAELTGQGVYDKGSVQLRNLAFASRAMSAGASLDIDAGGTLNGRIGAEVKTPNQTLRAALSITGSLQNPVVRK